VISPKRDLWTANIKGLSISVALVSNRITKVGPA
jgi:hypothetical protein